MFLFFDHQYLWKESVDILIFLRGNNHQGKAESETNTCGHFCLLSYQITGFFDQQNLWKESIDLLDFFAWRYSSRLPILVG